MMSRLSCSLSLNGCLCFLLLQPSVCSSVQRAGARERLLADLDRDRASAHAIDHNTRHLGRVLLQLRLALGLPLIGRIDLERAGERSLRRTVGELDFVLQQGSSVLPIEIKSGKTYQAHAALDHALEVTDWNLKKGYVFCQANLETKGKITYLPWYMVMFLKPLTVKDLKVEVKITNVD